MNYKTQMEAAKKGIVSKELAQVAKDEGFPEQELLSLVATGQVAIPANIHHQSLHPSGVGHGLRTKINVALFRYDGNSYRTGDGIFKRLR